MSDWKPKIQRSSARADNPLAAIRKLVRRGELEKAEKALTQRLEADPRSPDLVIMLARVLGLQKRHEEAARAFERAMELAPLSPEPSLRGGISQLRLGDTDRAVELFENALKLDPKLARAHLGLGAAKFLAGAYDDALDAVGEAIRLDPELARAHEVAARAHVRSGDEESAISELQTALEVDPGNERVMTLLARLLARENRSDEALSLLQSHAETVPDDRRALRKVARFAMRAKQPELAVTTYRRLSERPDALPTDKLRLIGALIDNNETEEAEALLQKVPKRRALQPVASKFIGDISFQRGKFIEAIDHYKRSCARAEGETAPEGVDGMATEEAADAWRVHAAKVLESGRRARRKRRGQQ